MYGSSFKNVSMKLHMIDLFVVLLDLLKICFIHNICSQSNFSPHISYKEEVPITALFQTCIVEPNRTCLFLTHLLLPLQAEMLTITLAVFQDLVHTSVETLSTQWTLEMQQYIVYCIALSLYWYIV